MNTRELRFDAPIVTTDGRSALDAAATFWFIVTAAGQWVFAIYIVSFYGGTVLHGTTARWETILTHGLIAGDHIGNVALAVHLSLAALITALGPLQLIPKIRVRTPRFHRWSGRTYLATALVVSVSALYLVWIRNAHSGSVVQALGITLDASLIVLCGMLSLRYALARRFDVHRRWAIRLFLVVSGVWFFRVGVFFSLLVNHGPFGFDPDTFEGPFLNVMSFSESLVPLAILELYFRAQAGRPGARKVMAGVLVVLTLAMSVGIFAVFTAAWLPGIKSA